MPSPNRESRGQFTSYLFDRHQGESSPLSSNLERLETLLKELGAVATLVLALGTPAVIAQYWSIGLPLQFVTHEEVIRAGILPSLTVLAIGWLTYLIVTRRVQQLPSVQRDHQAELRRLAEWAVGCGLLVVFSYASLYVLRLVHTEYEPTLRASFHIGWRVRLIMLAISIPFVFIGWYAIKGVRRLVRRVSSPNAYRWANTGIALFFAVLVLVAWVTKRALRIGELEHLPDVLAVALFIALFIILSTLISDLRSRESDKDRKKYVRQVVFVIALIYCSAVLFYSFSWYSVLPHYLGGGKPVAVNVWLAKGAIADRSVLNCADPNPDFALCEHLYMISLDTDYYSLC